MFRYNGSYCIRGLRGFCRCDNWYITSSGAAIGHSSTNAVGIGVIRGMQRATIDVSADSVTVNVVLPVERALVGASVKAAATAEATCCYGVEAVVTAEGSSCIQPRLKSRTHHQSCVRKQHYGGFHVPTVVCLVPPTVPIRTQ